MAACFDEARHAVLTPDSSIFGILLVYFVLATALIAPFQGFLSPITFHQARCVLLVVIFAVQAGSLGKVLTSVELVTYMNRGFSPLP